MRRLGSGSGPVQPPARESSSRRTLLYADEFWLAPAGVLFASSMLRRGDRVGDGEQFGIVAQQLEHLAIEPQLWHV